MSGVLLIALGACLPAFFFQAPGTDSDPVPNWDDLPVAKNRLLKTRLGEGAPAMALAEGLAVESPPLVDAGRVLGLASGRAGEVWILADTPQPSLPGSQAGGKDPKLIRFGKQAGIWRETGRFPVPDGSRRLAAAGREILLGAPGMVLRLSADKPDQPRPWLIQFRGVGEIPLPGIDEQGVAHVVVPSGTWIWKNAGAGGAEAMDPSVFIPDNAWGMVRLPLWSNGRIEVHATGLTPDTLWTTQTLEGEWIVSSPGGRGGFLQVVRAGNELGFRHRGWDGNSVRRLPSGVGAMHPLVVSKNQTFSGGTWVTASLGPDWRGTCWVGEAGRVTALSVPTQGGATRQAREKKTVFSIEGSGFFPVAMTEDAGGEGVWILGTNRDAEAAGQLPLERIQGTRLFLVKHPEWLAARDVISGPLAPDADIRDQLGLVPDGPGRWDRARELAGEGGTREERLAELALDTSVSLSTRRASWAGLAFAGKAGKWVGRMLGTDQTLLRASAARWCQSLTRLPTESSEPLLAAVQDADGAVSREAACAAALHRVPGVAESLAAALFQRDETDAQVQSANLHGLGLLGREGAERMLSAAQTGVRAEAVRALGARVGFPWPADQGGSQELWLEHPHLGPDQQALYLEGLRAWRGWAGGVDKSPIAALKWLEIHTDQPPELLEAGLRLSGDLPVGQSSLDWWRQMVRERKGMVSALAMRNLAQLPVPAWGGEVSDALALEELSSAERLAALRLFRRWDQPAAAIKMATPLLEPGALPGQSPAVTEEALKTLALLDGPGARDAAMRVVEMAKKSPSLLGEACRILIQDADTRRQITDSFPLGAKPKYPSLDFSVWLDALAATGSSAEYDRAVSRNWLADADGQAKLQAAVNTHGDARRGLFVALDRTRANCLGCHRFEGAGGGVGPPINPGQTPGALLRALVEPSAQVSVGHQIVRMIGAEGQEVRGVVLNPKATEGDWLLGDSGGRLIRLPRVAKEKAVTETGSLMPALGSLRLGHQDLMDLLAFFTQPPAETTGGWLSGLVLEAEARVGATGNWTWLASSPNGTLTPPESAFELRVPVFLPEKAEVTALIWGAKLAPGQGDRVSMPAGKSEIVLRLEQPKSAGKIPFALRLQGPQGMVVGYSTIR